jgi:hypothetical protein
MLPLFIEKTIKSRNLKMQENNIRGARLAASTSLAHCRTRLELKPVEPCVSSLLGPML